MDAFVIQNKEKEEVKVQPGQEVKAEDKKVEAVAGEQVHAQQQDVNEQIRAEKETALLTTLEDEYEAEQGIRQDVEAEQLARNNTVNAPDIDKMKSEHEVTMEYRLKKKNIIKPNEYELVPKVTDKESKTREKIRNSARVTRDIDSYKDRLIITRRQVPMKIKKHFDYHTFSTLNDITAGMQEKEGKQAMVLMAAYTSVEKKENAKKADERDAAKLQNAKETKLYPAMDMMATHIMNIDYMSLDMSTDSKLADNAYKLEEMSHAVQGFSQLLQMHPDYLDRLMDKKIGNTNVSFGERLMKRMDLLTAMSDYYRVRRLIIEDPTYASMTNEEISYEDKDHDSLQLKRLKKLMRSSFYLAQNLSAELGGRYRVPVGFAQANSEVTLLRNKIDYDSEDTARKNKEIKARLDYFKGQTKRMNELDNIRYTIAPPWMQNALSIDPAKQVEVKEKGSFSATGFGPSDMRLGDLNIRQTGSEKLANAFKNIPKTKKQDRWDGTPNFVGGKDAYLGELNISNNFDRSVDTISTGYSYRRTYEEMLEMLNFLAIQLNEEEWEKVTDQDERDFYESAYKEMAMKLISMEYEAAIRMGETFAMEAHILHPIDLIMQMSVRLRSFVMDTAAMTNVTTNANMPLVRELFKNNTDGRYNFDADRFENYAESITTVNFKMNEVMSKFMSILVDIEPEKCEVLFGDPHFYQNVIRREYNEAVADEKHPEHMSAVEVPHTNYNDIIIWFFEHHPEYITPEVMSRKYDGEYILSEAVQTSFFLIFNEGAKNRNYCVEHGMLKKYTREELDRYNESVKKRGLPKVRLNNANDNPQDDVVFVDEDGYQTTVKKSVIMANREADPYGVYFAGEISKELEFTDENGKKRYRDGGQHF